ARDVGALADIDEERFLVDGDRLEPGEPGLHGRARDAARRATADPLVQQPDVLRSRAAAAAENVDQARGRIIAQDLRGLLRRLVVLAEGIRQAGVGVRADAGIGDARELLDVGAELPPA